HQKIPESPRQSPAQIAPAQKHCPVPRLSPSRQSTAPVPSAAVPSVPARSETLRPLPLRQIVRPHCSLPPFRKPRPILSCLFHWLQGQSLGCCADAPTAPESRSGRSAA